MNCLMYLRKLGRFLVEVLIEIFTRPEPKAPKISLLIPFSSPDPIRRKNLRWLLRYWRHELPHAEIIIGHSKSSPFCKGEALNDAIRKSTGQVIVILDADAYLPGHIIERCANRILEEGSYGNRLWYVPYRNLFRLKKWVTDIILSSDPREPVRLHPPIDPSWVENWGDKSKYGHRYGAMIMMFPREAYEILGCFDERFKGWGGEDIALLRALDTLYAKHKTTNNDILHLWHPFIGEDYQTRMWRGQTQTNANSNLANEYHRATRKPSQMRDIVNEAYRYIAHKDHKNKFGNSK